MGRRSRNLRLELEWLKNYGKESTNIIIDLVAEYKKHCMVLLRDDLVTRIARLETAAKIWDVVKKAKETL